MIKVYNANTLNKEKREMGYALPLNLYKGDKQSNKESIKSEKYIDNKVCAMAENWTHSKGYFKLQNDIKTIQEKYRNDATSVTQAELEAFFGKILMDITKRYMEKPDLTSLIATEVTNEDFPENPNLKWFLKYRGELKEINGTGDSVPLLQTNTGATAVASLKIYGLGFAEVLKDLLYNTFYSIAKVNEAVSDAYIDFRNKQTIGAIVSHSYTSDLKVSAVTSGATADENMYMTLDKAESTIRKLKDVLTDRPINVPGLSLLINSADKKRISRVIDGQLNAFGKVAGKNLPALAFSNMIEYDRGINDGFYVGKTQISVPGVTAGKAYLFVPKEYFYVLVKRPLTMETSTGEALTLSQEHKAWYTIQDAWAHPMFGENYQTGVHKTGYGAIIEITLPEE